MSNTRSTPVKFLSAVHLCFLLLFCPKKFQQRQDEDNEQLKMLDSNGEERNHPSLVVRGAFFTSFLLVLVSGAIGFAPGFAMTKCAICASSKVIAWLQIVGACILLWGTLFIRGWEIQTHGGVTLTERVNQWIYRALYCFGTAVLVFSIAWDQCPKDDNAVVKMDVQNAAHPSPKLLNSACK